MHSLAGQAKALNKEILGLRRDAEALNNPDRFVESAKLNRLANNKEKELDMVWNDLKKDRKRWKKLVFVKVDSCGNTQVLHLAWCS